MNEAAKYPPLADEQVRLSNYLTSMAQHKVTGPTTPGECAAFCRIGCTEVLGVNRAWSPGPDAIGVYHLMLTRGLVYPRGTRAEVGDLMVWIDGHGPHGHIGMRVIGNRVAQNSTLLAERNGDPRGFLPLADMDPNYRVIRLWRP